MRLGQEVLSDLGVALAREWLLGNGLGGSASGTSVGANTRPGHAHLVAAGPHGRLTSLLLRLEERLHTDEGAFALGTDLPPGGPARPAGYRLLDEFRLDPWPVWRFRAGGVVLEKSLFLVNGHNAVVISYRHLSGPAARLTVSPLIAVRDPADIQRENPEMRGAAQAVPGRVRIETVPGGPVLTLWHNGAFMPARAWQRIHLPAESPAVEPRDPDTAFVPGYVEAPIAGGAAFQIVASAEGDLLRALAQEDRLGAPPPRTLAGCVAVIEAEERARIGAWRSAAIASADLTARQAAIAHGGGSDPESSADTLIDADDPWIGPLAEILRLGLVRRGRRLTFVTSLPGGEERVVDTLRILPGLIALRGFDAAREVLRGVIENLDEGLAPESFDRDDGTPRYGNPAASLWLVIAAERYARRSHDLEFAKRTLYPALEGVMQAFRSGTRDIKVDTDGLLATGKGAAFAKRAELNALWHHATVAMAQLARTIDRRESGAFYLAWANEHLKRFGEAFWDERGGTLWESIGTKERKAGTIPGQILAVSLSPPLLGGERATRLIGTLGNQLLTPFGLRERAGSTRVSPRWLGAYCTADLRVHGRSAEAQARTRAWFEALRARLDAAGPLLPEALELDEDSAPPRPVGDAVSIVAAAELLRLWVEELDRAPAVAAS